MMIDKDEFIKFQMEKSSSVIVTCIRCNYDVIVSLVNDGHSLQSIYDYLRVKKGVVFGYRGFCRAWKSFNEQKKKRTQPSSAAQTKNNPKKAVVSTTKTQFFEHNSSPSAELIASLTGETDE